MKLSELVELGDIVNYGKFHFGRTSGFGSIPGVHATGKRTLAKSSIICTAVHAVINRRIA
jgi:hypothetical protein